MRKSFARLRISPATNGFASSGNSPRWGGAQAIGQSAGKPHLAWKSTRVPALKLNSVSTSDFDPLAASGRDHRLQRLEAVLLMSREPLNSRKLSQFANLADGTEARTLLRRLNEWYDKIGRSFRVEEVAGGFQLLSRKKFGTWLQRLTHIPTETRLSAPGLETLAVIAYRQPVLRADIEAIRGVNCGEILRQLMERDLVRIGGRSEELGRPYLYCTTRRFLNLFGLVSLEELPRSEELRELPLENFAGPVPSLVLAEARLAATNLDQSPMEQWTMPAGPMATGLSAVRPGSTGEPSAL